MFNVIMCSAQRPTFSKNEPHKMNKLYKIILHNLNLQLLSVRNDREILVMMGDDDDDDVPSIA